MLVWLIHVVFSPGSILHSLQVSIQNPQWHSSTARRCGLWGCWNFLECGVHSGVDLLSFQKRMVFACSGGCATACYSARAGVRLLDLCSEFGLGVRLCFLSLPGQTKFTSWLIRWAVNSSDCCGMSQWMWGWGNARVTLVAMINLATFAQGPAEHHRSWLAQQECPQQQDNSHIVFQWPQPSAKSEQSLETWPKSLWHLWPLPTNFTAVQSMSNVQIARFILFPHEHVLHMFPEKLEQVSQRIKTWIQLLEDFNQIIICESSII